jgi:HEPN domain-containing protein
MRPEPDSPEAWLLSAHSDLVIASAELPGALVEHKCFHAQQAAEKSFKAILIAYGLELPRTHSIAVLLDLLPRPVTRVRVLSEAMTLAEYATTMRYPGPIDPIEDEEYQTAVRVAAEVLAWAEAEVRKARQR